MSGLVAEWFSALFLVVLVYILVRPGSAGADFIKSFTGALAAMVTAATDL